MKKRISLIFLAFLFILTLSLVLTACIQESGEEKYTVTFDTDGGSVVASQTVKGSDRVQKPNDPTKNGYDFLGWYKPNGDRWSFIMEVDRNVTLTAKWCPSTYKISYYLNGGKNSDNNPTKYLAWQDEILYPAQKLGYQFEGWYDTDDFSGERIDRIDGSQIKNIKLYAKWSGNGLAYALSSDGSYAILEAYSGKDSVVVVDEFYQGAPVTEIADSVFAKKSTITKISVPNSVKKIGVGAFADCSNLNTIDLPDNLNVISNDLFSECNKLPRVEIPSSVTEIGDNAFKGCNIITRFAIPASVTSLGAGVFSGCSKLQIVNIPSGITELKDNLFQGCASISQLKIPESVKSLGVGVFSGCRKLQIVNIPSGVTELKDNLFLGCASIAQLTIPASVTNFGAGVFAGCVLLEGVTIPSSQTIIGNRLFDGCKSITEIEIPSSVTEIGNAAFYGCSALTELNIPDTVKKIGNQAFVNCLSLSDVFIPSSVEEIGSEVLSGISGIKSLTLPFLGGGEGSNGSEDLKYTFGTTIPKKLEKVTINGGKVSGKPFTGADNLKEVYFGESVEFGSGAIFYECKLLTKVSGFSGSAINNLMFYNCVSLENFVISESVTAIHHKAFKNCTALKQIVIGENVTYIGDNAFEGCTSLSIKCRADALPSAWHEKWNISKCPVEWGYKG